MKRNPKKLIRWLLVGTGNSGVAKMSGNSEHNRESSHCRVEKPRNRNENLRLLGSLKFFDFVAVEKSRPAGGLTMG